MNRAGPIVWDRKRKKISKCPCQEMSELCQESSHSQREFGKNVTCKEMTVSMTFLPDITEVPQESVGSEKLVPERPGPWDSVCVIDFIMVVFCHFKVG